MDIIDASPFQQVVFRMKGFSLLKHVMFKASNKYIPKYYKSSLAIAENITRYIKKTLLHINSKLTI